MSYPLLENAPANHNSKEFLQYLKDNNTVVWEQDQWLVIENCKYHSPEKPWYTAFIKKEFGEWYWDIDILNYEFNDFFILIKPVSERTVKRPHVHLYKI